MTTGPSNQHTNHFGASQNHGIAIATSALPPEFLELQPSQVLKRRGEPGVVVMVAAWPGGRHISALRRSLEGGHNELRDVTKLIGARSRPRQAASDGRQCVVEFRLGRRLLGSLEISSNQEVAIAEISLSVFRFPVESLGISVRYSGLGPLPRLETLVLYQPAALSSLEKHINERVGGDIEPESPEYADPSFLVMQGGWALGDAMAALAAMRLRSLWARQDQRAGNAEGESVSGQGGFPWNASAEDLLRQRERQLRLGLIQAR